MFIITVLLPFYYYHTVILNFFTRCHSVIACAALTGEQWVDQNGGV